MSTRLRRKTASGRAVALFPPPLGTAPNQVGNLSPGTPGTTTIPVTYLAATGTAPITYSGETSFDGTTWVANSGTFTSSGGTFSGLSSGLAYYWRVVATNSFGTSRTPYNSTTTTSTPAATTYTSDALSPSSGSSGTTVTYTVRPGSGGWPVGEQVTPYVNGVAGAAQTGSGNNPVVFSLAVTGSAGAGVSITSSAPGMTNLTGSETFTVSGSIPATSGANRYDILVSDASGGTSTARTVSAAPNGNWSGGTLTLTATKAGGGTSSIGTLTLPSSGSSTQSASWTPPSAGEWTISGTNTAGLYNPWSPLYVAFAASGGTAQSISANSTYFLDQQPFQQDAWGGTPAGWTATNGATFGMGWGAFQVKVTPGGSSAALYGQLFDSDSSGASTTANTGTAISNVVQIYGTVSGGSEITINVNLPASDYTVYLDVATDSGMTNRARIPLRFRITDVVAIESPSQEDMWLVSYPYNGPPGNLNWSNYTKTMIAGAQNTDFGITTGQWYRIDGITHYDNNVAWGNVASMEAGRRFLSRKGHGCAVVGVAQVGQPVDSFILADGSPCSSFVAAAALCNNKFRYLRVDVLNGWGNHYTSESYAEYQTVFGAHATKMLSTYRALAVIGFSTGTSGYYGQNGSSTLGYGRLNKIIESQIEATNSCVVSTDNCIDWNEFYSGHASWASQTRFVRSALLAMFMAEGSHAGGYAVTRADRFATFAATGTLSGDTLYVPFTLPTGATNLIAKKWLNGTSAAGWTYSTPSAAELLSIVAVYAGSNTHWAGGTPILITGVTIDNTNKRLAIGIDRSAGAGMVTYFNGGGSVAQPSSFTVQLFSDFYVYNKDESYGVGVYDDRIIDDWGFGPHARPQLDVVCS